MGAVYFVNMNLLSGMVHNIDLKYMLYTNNEDDTLPVILYDRKY